jgi:hypothetical protein
MPPARHRALSPFGACAVSATIGRWPPSFFSRSRIAAVTNQYETGVEVSKEDIDQLRLKRHKLHPDWNYTLLPRS